jgi:hypothetical protein
MTSAAPTNGTLTVVREWAGYNGDPGHDKTCYRVCTFDPTPAQTSMAQARPL